MLVGWCLLLENMFSIKFMGLVENSKITFMRSSYFWYCNWRLKIWLKMVGFLLWDPYFFWYSRWLLGFTINKLVMSFWDMRQLPKLTLELLQLLLELMLQLLVFCLTIFLSWKSIISQWFYYNTFLISNKMIDW